MPSLNSVRHPVLESCIFLLLSFGIACVSHAQDENDLSNTDLDQTFESAIDEDASGSPNNDSESEDLTETDDDLKQRVADLRYGNALFHYFQGQELSALTELLVAEERGGIKGHGDNPALMQAGISLAYGMADTAQETFVELLDQNRPERVRNAAWYYLARMHYLRENWASSNEAVSRITNDIEDDLRPAVQMIRTDLAIKNGQLDEAQNLLSEAKAFGIYLPFAYFNLATALSRDSQYDLAAPYYERATKAAYNRRPVDDSDLALIDKIRTAAGFNYLISTNYQAAIDEFKRVQLESLDADMALLGYGRASMEQKDYLEALKPWGELANRSLIAPGGQEALLSIPVAYEELGATGEALTAYEHAENTFLSELDRIDELIKFLQENRLDAAATLTQPGNWFESRAEAASAPRANQLTELFALNRFQARIHEFQDIQQLRTLMDKWVIRLALYSDMLVERQLDRENDATALRAMDLDQQIGRLESESQELAGSLDDIAKTRDYFALTTADTSDLVERVEDSSERIAKLRAAGEDTGEYGELLRRYEGILFWNAAENFASERYKSQLAVAEMNSKLVELKANNVRVKQLFSSAPDILPYQVRIDNLQARLRESSDYLDALINKSEEQLLAEISDELATQKRRLLVYLSQARLSIARIYDASNMRQQ